MLPVATNLITTRVLAGFDDPSFGQEEWNALVERSPMPVVYLTWEFQRAWWEALGRGRLLLIVAAREGRVVALAPFFVDERTVYFVGSRYECDYLDFIGDVSDPAVLDALLGTARDSVAEFSGFGLYFLSGSSRTPSRLAQAAQRLGLRCDEEWRVSAPVLRIAGNLDVARAKASKADAIGRERFFERTGVLDVQHFRNGDEILPQLGEFFDQHVRRWEAKGQPSGFTDPRQRAFIERLTEYGAHTGWLRFTRMDWEGRSIAFHHGTCYRGRYVVGIRSFEIELTRRSPGHVLFRQLLLAAIGEGADTFDMGIGDQDHKLRYATEVGHVLGLGLYPRDDDG